MKHNNTANRKNIETEIERFANTATHIEDIIESMPSNDAPFVEAIMDRVGECEQGIRHLQEIVTRINDSSEQYILILETQQNRIETIKSAATGLLQELALRQVCTSTKSKIFREIAGKRLSKWEELQINQYSDLESKNLESIVYDNDNDKDGDFNYFYNRWILLKQTIGISQNESKLKRMYKNCVADGNELAHADYQYTKDELATFINQQCQKGDTRKALLTFMDYDEKLSDKRCESLYECDWEQYFMKDN